ncbi:MAG: hypothetical protein FDZ70_07920 [Actinobacteria bacterium]|nr:MAG: hypothetical protein FDZ70_07920 [Actinomycetota bacterium]
MRWVDEPGAVPDAGGASGAGGAAATGTLTGRDSLSKMRPDPNYAVAHPEPYSWASTTALIAHGMGGVAPDRRVTNTLEAFITNRDAGYRVFEADLVFSKDGRPVCRHGWESYLYEFLGQKVDDQNALLTDAEFEALPVHGTMTALTLDDLVTLMKAYPDTWIVTDTKSKEPAEVERAMRAILEAVGDDRVLLERFVIQVYDEDMLATVRKVHDFRNVIYTLYQLEGTPEAAIDYAAASGVKVVAMPDTMWSAALAERARDRKLVTAVYTVNDPKDARRYLDSGVTLLYSDFLTPADL